MKRIIICCDGTWNKPDQENRGKRKPSNVIKMVRGINPIDQGGTHQIVYYQIGVGTGRGSDKWLGGGTGMGLSENIIESYRFLANNYVAGDQVYLFGFSRGAYTARSIVGLIDVAGLLPKDNIFYMKEAYELYHSQADADEATVLEQSKTFKQKHECLDVPIEFLGVWDTVGALGVPVGLFSGLNKKYAFHKVVLSPSVKGSFHALAIDERRKAFAPTLWSPDQPLSKDKLEQRWFAGVHSNIGGGYDQDGLANVALHWLKDKAKTFGLECDETFLGNYEGEYWHTLENTMKGKYRLLGKYGRPIGKTKNGNETVDETAIRRYKEKFEGYAPKNLAEYCAEHGIDVG